jgi:hypothetical protein
LSRLSAAKAVIEALQLRGRLHMRLAWRQQLPSMDSGFAPQEINH